MGYTGTGLNRERASPFGIDLMFSRQFEAWYNTFFRSDPNQHGIYNGMNLAGLDVARLFLALRKNPALTIPEFLNDEETFYKVAVPKARHFDLLKLYPWMVAGGKRSEGSSWEVSFARSDVPLTIALSERHVTQPELSYVKKSSIEYSHLTRDEVSVTRITRISQTMAASSCDCWFGLTEGMVKSDRALLHSKHQHDVGVPCASATPCGIAPCTKPRHSTAPLGFPGSAITNE